MPLYNLDIIILKITLRFNMKVGIILFVLGLILVVLLIRFKFDKEIIKNAGVFIGVIIAIYGLILMVQPNEDKYFDYTKTTISSDKIKKNK